MATKERRDELVTRLERLGPVGEPWVKNLKDAKCPLCGGEVDESEFRDELSLREYELSHMCLSCQLETFKKDDS